MVSVILPTFNRASVLPRAISTVLAQDYSNLELIVVDDGSTDGTDKVVAHTEDSRVVYCRLEQNGGPAVARNAGIRLARGSLIAFQDSDDEWLPGKLGKQVRTLLAAGDALTFSYSSFWHEVNGRQEQIPTSSQIAREGSTSSRLLHGNFIGTPALVVSRRCLELSGAFDESMRSLEDWDLALRLSRVAQAVFVDEPLVLAHDSSLGANSQDAHIMLASLNTIYSRYAADFLRDRSADAEMHLCMAIECTRGGGVSNWGACVRHSSLACLRDPANVKAWVYLLASLTGLKSVVGLRRLSHRLKSVGSRIP